MKTMIILFLLLVGSADVFAQAGDSTHHRHRSTPPWYVDRFRISAGFFVPFNHTSISIGNTSGTRGTELSFETTLGITVPVIRFWATSNGVPAEGRVLIWHITASSGVLLIYWIAILLSGIILIP